MFRCVVRYSHFSTLSEFAIAIKTKSTSKSQAALTLQKAVSSHHTRLHSSFSKEKHAAMTRPLGLPYNDGHTPTRTVLVLGASYAGHRAVQQLVAFLPSNWRVVVLERNTHFNHLYAFPRMSVVPGHEHKIFIPYTKLFQPLTPPAIATNNVLVHGSLTSLSPSTNKDGKPAVGRGVARYAPLGAKMQDSDDLNEEINFDYLVYGLGSQLPAPINLWSLASEKRDCASSGLKPKIPPVEAIHDVEKVYNREVTTSQTRGTKDAGMKWLQTSQDQIREAESVLIIGAGALGVQYASDIAYTFGTPTSEARWKGHVSPPKVKKVTLLSSSARILPRFQPWMHEEGVRRLNEMGVHVITGSRADLSTLGDTNSRLKRKIKTLDGQEIEADLVLFCTGQKSNTDYLNIYGNVVETNTGMAAVTSYLQLTQVGQNRNSINDDFDQNSLNHIFIIGDAADAFGALNAGHNAAEQGEVAARNIARLIAIEEGKIGSEQVAYESWLLTPLESYKPSPHKIKVSMGHEVYLNENNGNHRIIPDQKEDLNATNLWLRRGLDVDDMTV